MLFLPFARAGRIGHLLLLRRELVSASCSFPHGLTRFETPRRLPLPPFPLLWASGFFSALLAKMAIFLQRVLTFPAHLFYMHHPILRLYCRRISVCTLPLQFFFLFVSPRRSIANVQLLLNGPPSHQRRITPRLIFPPMPYRRALQDLMCGRSPLAKEIPRFSARTSLTLQVPARSVE